MANKEDKSKEQEVAEAEVEGFRKDLGPFVVAAETTRMAMVFTDAREADNPIIFANNAFLSLTGYDREEVLGHSFTSLMARGVDQASLAEVEATLDGRTDLDLDIHYRRKDGSEFWASLFVSPVRDERGNVLQHFASLMDLTRHQQDQVRCRMLIDELNHRVKNTLSTVQSVVSQGLRKTSAPEVIRESIESRLFALSRSHDLLTRENWEGAGLRDLVKTALEPFEGVDGRAQRFVITGGNIYLQPKTALALGIAFHELAINAVTHGAFSNETGTILIAWRTELKPEGNRLILRWQEKDGPPVTPPSRKGLGARVLERGLPHELESKVQLDYPVDGVVCTIDIPAPQGARDG